MLLAVVASVLLLLPVAACQSKAVPATAPAPEEPEEAAPVPASAEIKPETVPADTQPGEMAPPEAPSDAPVEATAPSPVPDDAAPDEPVLSTELRRNDEMMTSGGKRGFDKSGLGIGETAVNFSLRDIDGRECRLSSILAEKPVVMVFGSFT
jgi:hypothetical protein